MSQISCLQVLTLNLKLHLFSPLTTEKTLWMLEHLELFADTHHAFTGCIRLNLTLIS